MPQNPNPIMKIGRSEAKEQVSEILKPEVSLLLPIGSKYRHLATNFVEF